MKNKVIELELLSEEILHEQPDYDETVKTYKCPCGKGTVVWSKERPNGGGFGYQATYFDAFIYCDVCKNKYDTQNYGILSLK